MTSRRPLPLLALTLPLILAAIAACSEEAPSGIRALLASPSGSSSPPPAGASPGDTATPPTAPTAAPTAAPTPFSTLVTITPASVTLCLPDSLTAGHGAPIDLPSQATLKAVVTFSDGSTSSAVTWSSLSTAWVHVSSEGVVSAIATDALTVAAPVGVRVRASALDGKAGAFRDIDISTDGGVAVSVQ